MSSSDVVKIGRSKKGKRRKWFRFQFEDDTTIYKLPLVQHLDRDLLSRMRMVSVKVADLKTGKIKKNAKPADVIEAMNVQEDVLNRYCPGLIDKLEDPELADLMERWKNASNSTLGESSASST